MNTLSCRYCGGPLVILRGVPWEPDAGERHEDSWRWTVSCATCQYQLLPRNSREAAIAQASQAIGHRDIKPDYVPVDKVVVCNYCYDTHWIHVEDKGDWMCTHCPSPCQKCRAGGNGAFCEHTPCSCECHKNHYQYAGRKK